MSEKQPKLIIIDGNALIHRAWHALPPTLTTKKGIMVNAVYGFTSILLRALKDLKPDYVVATFDLKAPTFRHKAYKEYKAKRVKQPDELYQQFPLIKEVVSAFQIPILEKEGYEADDIIATIVERVNGQMSNVKCIIVTGDMDTFQLVDENTEVYSMHKGISDTIISDEKAPKKNFQFLLDPNIKTSEYAELDEKKLEVFLKREAERLGVSLDSESWKLFVSHVGSFPLRSAAGVRELEKCTLFSKNKILNEDGLRSIIQTSETEDVYGVARTLASERRREKRMAILERAFINKVDPAHLFNTLVYAVNGVGIERLAQLDVKIKSGNAEYEEALLEFVLN